MIRPIKFLSIAMMLAVPVAAQTTSPTGQVVVAANPGDAESIDAIVTALYDVISGPAGKERNWDRFRSLFVPDARLIPTFVRQGSTGPEALVWTVDQYINRAGRGLAEQGFFEREVHRVEERFENIAHAFSTYESTRAPGGDAIAKGINSIQLMWDGDRWWIVNIFWRGVGPDAEIPAKYWGMN